MKRKSCLSNGFVLGMALLVFGVCPVFAQSSPKSIVEAYTSYLEKPVPAGFAYLGSARAYLNDDRNIELRVSSFDNTVEQSTFPGKFRTIAAADAFYKPFFDFFKQDEWEHIELRGGDVFAKDDLYIIIVKTSFVNGLIERPMTLTKSESILQLFGLALG
jgi:hypothetical protein